MNRFFAYFKDQMLFSPSRAHRIIRYCVIFLIAFELLNFGRALSFTVEFTWLGLVLTSLFSYILLEGANYHHIKREGRELHWSLWLLVGIALSLDLAADLFGLYSRFPWYDSFLHFLSSGIVCAAFFFAASSFLKGRRGLSILLSASSTLALSALYEVEEYTEDLVFHTNRLGPGTDTANDLLWNALGVAVAASACAMLAWRRKRSSETEGVQKLKLEKN